MARRDRSGPTRRGRPAAGFTLAEILVVLVIVVMLIWLAVAAYRALVHRSSLIPAPSGVSAGRAPGFPASPDGAT